MIFLVIGSSQNILSFIFKPEYGIAGDSLKILIIGISFLSVFIITSMIIIGSGKPIIPMIIGLAMVPISAILNYLLIPLLNLDGAAYSTTITALIGMIISLIYILYHFKILMSLASLIKIIIGSIGIFLIASFIQPSGFLLIPIFIALIIVYLGILYILKEIKPEDINLIKGVFYRLRKN
jgi:stage V sporulation protein B